MKRCQKIPIRVAAAPQSPQEVNGFRGGRECAFEGVVETFQNQDGSRVASRWRVVGRNNGLMDTEPNGAPFEMCGTAVWEVGTDGLLRHNWVERNALEVYGAITRSDGRHNVF